MRGNRSNLATSPVLIGAATCLVVLVAMALSYNANSGLPFVPTYAVKAQVPDAAQLTRGNEVRVGGKRVGVISALKPAQGPERAYAELSLELEKRIEPLPADSQILVRPRSPLGLRYLELRPGTSRETIPPGGTIPIANAGEVVDLDEVLNALDETARADLQSAVRDLGDGFAGRGLAVNATIESARPLLTHLQPVAENLAAPLTDLTGLVSGAATAASALAAEAPRAGSLLDGAARTFAAVAGERDAVGELLAEAPPTEAVAEPALRESAPVLRDAAAIARALRPAAARLDTAATRLASVLETGTPTLRRATALADRLGTALGALDELVRRPATGGAVRRLTDVVASLEPTLRYVNPFQTTCNYLGVWTRNASETISEGDVNGTWFRFIPVFEVDEVLQRSTPAPGVHVNMYPHAGRNGECEAGNEGYAQGTTIGNTAEAEPGRTEDTAPPEGVPLP